MVTYNTPKGKIVITVGKRKTAIAKAIIRPGRGIVRINKILLNVFHPPLARMKIEEPLILAGEDRVKKVDIDVFVKGGGVMAQAEAARLAIARGLVEYFNDKTLEKKYEMYDKYLLVADVRRTEPQKPYKSAARRTEQISKR